MDLILKKSILNNDFHFELLENKQESTLQIILLENQSMITRYSSILYKSPDLMIKKLKNPNFKWKILLF